MKNGGRELCILERLHDWGSTKRGFIWFFVPLPGLAKLRIKIKKRRLQTICSEFGKVCKMSKVKVNGGRKSKVMK